jgi:predicted NBD/HSP70 family sugar kinase
MKEDPERVRKIYETVGIYLGYALAQYQEFYDIEHVLILGRLSKGDGGDIMLDMAKKVLAEEFPNLKQPEFHTADDHFKAVGQCIAAAALPVISDDEMESKMTGMPACAEKYLLAKPKFAPPLDQDFAPFVLGKAQYLKAAKGSPHKLTWALPRADGCGTYSLPVFDDEHPDVEASIYVAGVCIQEMIWQRSATSLLLHGPAQICQDLKGKFSSGGMYDFEVKSMPNVCGTPEKPFEVTICKNFEDLPPNRESPQVCGKDASGCRLAFDLGKSDVKTVAVKDNEVVYSKETEWDVTNTDPDYHFKVVTDALKLAKETLPRVDAIGGSATGTISAENHATWCDIFPNVPPAVYKEKVVDIFVRMAKDVAGRSDVPLKVINDGEVTALAAVQKLKKGSIMAFLWVVVRVVAMPTKMATFWVGSMSCATSGLT